MSTFFTWFVEFKNLLQQPINCQTSLIKIWQPKSQFQHLRKLYRFYDLISWEKWNNSAETHRIVMQWHNCHPLLRPFTPSLPLGWISKGGPFICTVLVFRNTQFCKEISRNSKLQGKNEFHPKYWDFGNFWFKLLRKKPQTNSKGNIF